MMERTGVVDTRCVGVGFVGVRMHMMVRSGLLGIRCAVVGLLVVAVVVVVVFVRSFFSIVREVRRVLLAIFRSRMICVMKCYELCIYIA